LWRQHCFGSQIAAAEAARVKWWTLGSNQGLYIPQ
jgi:hypothetical protein